MSKSFKTAALALVLLGTGCAAQLLSDERLRSNTAGALGEQPEDIVIGNRREQTPNTYYTATTKKGKEYSCIINGGGILAGGMVLPPSCTLKGEAPKPYKPFG